MSYMHPTYEPRNNLSGFTRGLSDDPQAWRDFVISSSLSIAARATVARNRAAGVDIGAIPGIGIERKPSRPQRPVAAHVPKTKSISGRLREALKAGPLTAVELAQAVGIERRLVRSYLSYDIDRKWIISLHNYTPVRYALVGGPA